jgi:hypothetical protein
VSDLPLPHDLEAEAAVLGWLLVDHQAIGEALWQLTPGDFYSPKHAAVYRVLLGFHERFDDRAVLLALEGSEPPVGVLDLVDLTSSASPAWRTHLARLVDLHARRQLAFAASEALEAAGSAADPTTAAEALTVRLRQLLNPAGAIPESLRPMEDVADRATDQAPWTIPGLLRRGWRTVVVGPEGGGKSLLLLQMAMLASAGIHPLHYQAMPAITTLVVDLENPDDEVTARLAAMRRRIESRHGDWDRYRPWIWEEPGGIDLRSRRHRGQLDAICSQVQPDLVCLGPVYKSYEKRDGERGHEDGVRHLQSILDDLRTRHGFALVLEHHAPMDAGGYGGKRVQRPSDTMLWLRWPEIGIGLTPDDEHPRSVMHCKRWRGDRVKASWPERIEYGQAFPWQGVWKEDGGATGNAPF